MRHHLLACIERVLGEDLVLGRVGQPVDEEAGALALTISNYLTRLKLLARGTGIEKDL